MEQETNPTAELEPIGPERPAALVPALEPEEPESPADVRARKGLLMSWIGFYGSIIAWALGLWFLIGYALAWRHEPDAVVAWAPWLVIPAAGVALACLVLTFLARRRVRVASQLHASLDFLSACAWHLAWSSLIVALLGNALFYSAYSSIAEAEESLSVEE